ncbi:MAG: dicarboxylate/amino acid:cation symporter [Bacilli bacterium]|nr:dicarboxylate/amino acid:cation symporter [Bacilli bacterium]
MKNFVKNYKSTIILIFSIILGTIIGLIFGEKTSILSPFGDLFINLLLMIITPLIFLTITTSIGKMKQPKRLSKILTSIVIVFIITSLISVLIGLISTRINLVNIEDSIKIKETLDYSIENTKEDLNILERTVNAISTNNFVNLLSKDNIIALIIFSILIGLSINLSNEKGIAFLNLLDSINEVLQKFIKIIMYYAPIGLGCYFASFVGTFGASIAIGYLKTFIIYTISCLFVYFIIYSLYAFIAGGKIGFKNYWKNIIPATLTALATCSSAASIPINTECAKKIGVSNDIAETTIPLGTSFHKDGSIIGSVFKIMFLVYLFGTNESIWKILGVALIATILVTAVPIGGGTISEMLIITMMNFPIAALPILTIIATIIDAPATVLNVVGDSASSMIVSRIVDGKNWLKQKKKLR